MLLHLIVRNTRMYDTNSLWQPLLGLYAAFCCFNQEIIDATWRYASFVFVYIRNNVFLTAKSRKWRVLFKTTRNYILCCVFAKQNTKSRFRLRTIAKCASFAQPTQTLMPDLAKSLNSRFPFRARILRISVKHR